LAFDLLFRIQRGGEDDGQKHRASAQEDRPRELDNDRANVPLTQIAAALGYSEASAFTRAFQRWSGQTPTKWRTGYAHA
jgi:AraC-like DNA-binding protein